MEANYDKPMHPFIALVKHQYIHILHVKSLILNDLIHFFLYRTVRLLIVLAIFLNPPCARCYPRSQTLVLYDIGIQDSPAPGPNIDSPKHPRIALNDRRSTILMRVIVDPYPSSRVVVGAVESHDIIDRPPHEQCRGGTVRRGCSDGEQARNNSRLGNLEPGCSEVVGRVDTLVIQRKVDVTGSRKVDDGYCSGTIR
jgi:hypothetical protein